MDNDSIFNQFNEENHKNRQPVPLVVRFGAFGDMVMLTSLMKRLHERYGVAPDLLTSGPWSLPLLEGRDFVGEIICLRSRRFPYHFSIEQRNLVKRLGTTRPRPVYLCDDTPKTSWLLKRAGFVSEQLCELTHLHRKQSEHTVELLNRFSNETPAYLESPPPVLEIPQTPIVSLPVIKTDQEECHRWLVKNGWSGKPIILIQPGNKKSMKRGWTRRKSNIKYWDPKNWAKVIDTIGTDIPDAVVLICGVSREGKIARAIIRQCGNDRVFSIVHELPLRRLLALLSAAHSMVSVDTGPAHAAAATGCPLVVLFNVTDPVRHRPIGHTSPVWIVTPKEAGIDNWKPGEITPDQVIAKWRHLNIATRIKDDPKRGSWVRTSIVPGETQAPHLGESR